MHQRNSCNSCSLEPDGCRKGGLIGGKKRPTLCEKGEQVSDFLYVLLALCSLVTLRDHSWELQPCFAKCLLARDNRSVSAPEEFPSCVSACVEGGSCQTMWSQLKEMHAKVFDVSSQRTNKWFYISAFNHERAGAIFTREQRTSLLLTCFTLFRWFCVSTSHKISQRCSHILMQKSS